MYRLGVYGWHGYLGNSICTSYPDVLKIERYSLVDSDFDVVIDCSFPSGKLKKTTAARYLDLIHQRANFYKTQNVKYIYLGSYSSIKPLKNNYGKVKFLAERLVLESSGIVIKLGLVVNSKNPGGRYSELTRILKTIPVLVLPHESTFEIFVDREHDVIQSISYWDRLSPSNTYLLKTTEKCSLGVVAKCALPTKSIFSLDPILSNFLEQVVRFLPTDFFSPLKGISVKRNLDFRYLEVINDE